MNKVTFVENAIFVNGKQVGNFNGSSEVWVSLNVATGAEFAGRFKYASPKATAKRFIKWCLQRFSPEEIVAGCEATSPYGWAQSKGFDPMTKKQRASHDAYMVIYNARQTA
jgi:hypothetical protein